MRKNNEMKFKAFSICSRFFAHVDEQGIRDTYVFPHVSNFSCQVVLLYQGSHVVLKLRVVAKQKEAGKLTITLSQYVFQSPSAEAQQLDGCFTGACYKTTQS